MSGVSMLDSTAERSIEELCALCEKENVKLILSHVHDQPLKVLKKCGVYERLGADRFCSDIDVAIERAKALLEAETKE
jgi:SulP family sulfate permease